MTSAMESSSSRQSQEADPQRLSALYQYHNAPEVAPAHGLEYDDTIYPSSDKYPVVREHAAYDKYGKYGFQGDNRPPRIIFGMKLPTFLVVAAVMTLVVVGAAVGGAVGGQQMRSAATQNGSGQPLQNATVVGSTPTTTAAATSSSFVAATPTYLPLSDCPASNNTNYTASYSQSSSGSGSSQYHFTKYCNVSSPLNITGSSMIAESFVYSFSDCVDVCGSYNHFNNGANCNAAVYQPGGSRPANCWVGNSGSANYFGALNATAGTDVALLTQ